MALTPITITWGENDSPVVNPDGSVATGALTFVLMLDGQPVSIEDSVTGETAVPLPIVGAVNNGQLLANPVGGGPYTPLVLLANNDPTTVPVGTAYQVTEQLVAGNLPPWLYVVHFDAAGATQSVVSQRPTP